MADKKVEFIESYIKHGNSDYKWDDNHGELVRCKDCIHVCDYTDIYPKSEGYKCMKNGNFHDENWFCADGVRKEGDSDGEIH